jgi:hypothetical protein
MKAKLIDSGFSGASTRFYFVSPRQIQYKSWKDGVWVTGAIAKEGARVIGVSLEAPGVGHTYRYTLPFVP